MLTEELRAAGSVLGEEEVQPHCDEDESSLSEERFKHTLSADMQPDLSPSSLSSVLNTL